MPQDQGTKLVKVEGQMVRVPVDATPDEIDQIVGGGIRPEARQPGAMQRKNPSPQPGERIGGPIFNEGNIKQAVAAKQGYKPGSFQMHEGGPIINPEDIKSLVSARTGIGNTLPFGTEPLEARQLAVAAGRQYPQELASRVSSEPYYDAALSPLVLLAGYGMGNPIASAKGLAGSTVGAPVGAALGRYAGGPKYGDIGAGLGGLVGGMYGGYRAMKGGSIVPPGMAKVPGMVGRIGRALNAFAEEPGAASAAPGAAREAAGGTAATTGPAGESTQTALGSQAGPSGPKNAGELSATVQRIRGGQGPGTAAASPTIYTPESLASEQGMSTAALGRGGFNLTIPPAQQEIMRRVAEAPPGTFTPKPSQGFESLGRTSPFPNAPPMNPPSGTSPSFGEPEGPLDAAIRGAAGQNPVIKSTDRAMAGEMPSKIKFMNLIRKKAQEGR